MLRQIGYSVEITRYMSSPGVPAFEPFSVKTSEQARASAISNLNGAQSRGYKSETFHPTPAYTPSGASLRPSDSTAESADSPAWSPGSCRDAGSTSGFPADNSLACADFCPPRSL